MEKTANLELVLINPSEWATTYSKDFLNALMGVDGSSNMSKIDAAVAALEEAVRTIPSPITGETVTAKATVGISKGNVVRLERLDGAYVAAMATSTTEATQYWLGIADNDIAAEQTGSVTMVVAVTSSLSVYQQAVAAGYTGTAEDFGRALANIDKKPNAKEVSFSGAESGMASADVQAAIEEVHAEAINKSTTASNVSFDPSRTTMKSTTAQDAFVELFTNVSDGKRQVASAVTDKGVPTSEDATFSIIAEHVRAISTGTDTSDADITAADVRSGKVGYGKDGKIVGAAPDVAVPTPVISVSSGGLITASATQNTGFVAGGSANATQQLPTQNALTIQPRTFTQSVQGQHYLLGDIDVLGDANLKPENIKDGVTIFGVTGTAKGSGGMVGTYTGDQNFKISTPQEINLGFRPKFVFVSDVEASLNQDAPWYYYSDIDDAGDESIVVSATAAYAFDGMPMETVDTDGSAVNCLEITSNGFRVANGYQNKTSSNGVSRRTRVAFNNRLKSYMYIAVP